MTTPDGPLHDPSAVAAEFALHARTYAAPALAEALARIKARGRKADTTAEGWRLVVEAVKPAIAERRPWAMVRIGDAAGNLLGYEGARFANLRVGAIGSALHLTFGTTAFGAEEVDDIAAGLKRGIVNADVLGVSDEFRLSRLAEIDAAGDATGDIRGLSGSRESYVAVDRILTQADAHLQAVVSNHMHRHIAPHMADMLKGVDRMTVIGPYDLASALGARFGVAEVRTLLIPNQSDTSGEGSKWYPGVYRALVDRIDPARDGHVHLVAAGLMAASICAEIKARGGLALDIGSLIDVWAGRAVRRYHTPDYVRALSIVEASVPRGDERS